MHFYTHNVGDFAIETKFMTFEQKGIYVDLVDHYLASGKPLASDWLANLKRLASDGAVEAVLSACFEEDGDVFRSAKLDKMLQDYEKRAEKNRENAKKPRKKSNENRELGPDSESVDCVLASGKRIASESLTTNNHKPLTNNQLVNKKTKQKKVAEKPDGVTEQVWDDFLLTRKEKKAPLTQTALDLIKSEAEKAGISLNDALSMACSRGWQSFKAEWVQGVRNGSFSAPSIEPRPKSFETDWDAIDYGVSRPLSEC